MRLCSLDADRTNVELAKSRSSLSPAATLNRVRRLKAVGNRDQPRWWRRSTRRLAGFPLHVYLLTVTSPASHDDAEPQEALRIAIREPARGDLSGLGSRGEIDATPDHRRARGRGAAACDPDPPLHPGRRSARSRRMLRLQELKPSASPLPLGLSRLTAVAYNAAGVKSDVRAIASAVGDEERDE